MKKHILAILSLATLPLAGCTETNQIGNPLIEEMSDLLSKTMNIDYIFKETEVTLILDSDFALGKYEPYEGVYLGAYMGNQDISEQDFINSLETDLAFKVFHYTKPNSITPTEILKCIANKQTPYFKFLFSEKISDFYYLIGDMKRMFNIPIFLELYPLSGKEITDPQKYKDSYIETYNIIKEHIPNTVFVYSVDYNNIEDALIFYPGDEYVDWIGLNLYMPKYENNIQIDYNRLKTQLDVWYKSFQEKKPLMFSGLAISHYSSVDLTYTIAETMENLNFFYADMLKEYPRIKAILYTDVDNRDYGKEDDFRISINEDLTKLAKKLWNEDIFLHQLSDNTAEDQSSKIAYTVPAYIYNDIYYVQDIYVKNIIDSEILNTIEVFKDIEGNIYYPLEYLSN
ncbi:MAG: hypothetical protein ATN31_05355 [Candidatus Epulonipiscioides saccharophilum]|nr:MAG: hypothetical protein ATN31_05355 [Epulopiscium sp. AS2M-Bin001]